MTAHAGACHCGNVAFEVQGEFKNAMVCNCSYCRRAGHLLAFTTSDNFSLKSPAANLSNYLFNKRAINHYFCGVCGIATHGGGIGPDGREMVAVNLRCVPDIDLDNLDVQKFDGASL